MDAAMPAMQRMFNTRYGGAQSGSNQAIQTITILICAGLHDFPPGAAINPRQFLGERSAPLHVIKDRDFSVETIKLASAQILAHASTAMLAQANQSHQGVLNLQR
jgi:hypothetical protein